MITSHAKRIFTRCILLIAGLIVATAPARADSIRAAIKAQNAKFSAAASKADGAGFSALYTADAQVLPAGRDAVKGTDELRTFWQGVLDSGVAGVSLKTLEVYAQGTHATEVGEYNLKDKAGESLDHGKYVVVWKREGGDWKLFRDIFTSSVAPKK